MSWIPATKSTTEWEKAIVPTLYLTSDDYFYLTSDGYIYAAKETKPYTEWEVQ